jgi:hypothetical protein
LARFFDPEQESWQTIRIALPRLTVTAKSPKDRAAPNQQIETMIAAWESSEWFHRPTWILGSIALPVGFAGLVVGRRCLQKWCPRWVARWRWRWAARQARRRIAFAAQDLRTGQLIDLLARFLTRGLNQTIPGSLEDLRVGLTRSIWAAEFAPALEQLQEVEFGPSRSGSLEDAIRLATLALELVETRA